MISKMCNLHVGVVDINILIEEKSFQERETDFRESRLL